MSMNRRKGWTCRRLIVTTCMQGAGAPMVDGASTTVECWGEGTHGALVVRRPGARDRPSNAVVIGWRGWHGPHVWLWRARWHALRHPIRTRRAPRGVVMGGTSSDAASA